MREKLQTRDGVYIFLLFLYRLCKEKDVKITSLRFSLTENYETNITYMNQL